MSGFKYIRPSWDTYFFDIVNIVGTRATCGRGRSGCIITKDKHILTTGYVGAPVGFPSCDDIGHLIQDVVNSDGTMGKHCIRTVHAEQNAICQAAKLGISLKDSTLYCTMTPCRTCAMLIIQCGIKEVKCLRHYPHKEIDDNVITMFKYAKIECTYVYEDDQEYEG